MTDLLFFILSVVAIFSGWHVFTTDSMVRASFLLLISFIAVGLIILLLGAPYIGVSTIFMMAVEMMVMALFMVMFMMNPAGLNPMSMVHQPRLAVFAGLGAFAGMTLAVLLSDLPFNPVAAGERHIHNLGVELLGNSMLIFETAGVTLLATMVGAVVLSSRSGRFGTADEGSLPPPLHHGGAPAGRRPEKGGDGHHHHHGDSHGGHGSEDSHGSCSENGERHHS